MFSTYLAAASLLISLGALVFALHARAYARDCYEFVQAVSQSKPEFDELAALSAELTTQKDALKQISAGLRTIRNRMNVRETNARRKVDTGTAEESDEDWIRRVNAELQIGKPLEKES